MRKVQLSTSMYFYVDVHTKDIGRFLFRSELFLMQTQCLFSGISVDNLIGRIITGKGVDGCSCMISESILLRTLLLSCTEVNGSPGECIVTGHGFERKSWGGGGKGEEERRQK